MTDNTEEEVTMLGSELIEQLKGATPVEFAGILLGLLDYLTEQEEVEAAIIVMETCRRIKGSSDLFGMD